MFIMFTIPSNYALLDCTVSSMGLFCQPLSDIPLLILSCSWIHPLTIVLGSTCRTVGLCYMDWPPSSTLSRNRLNKNSLLLIVLELCVFLFLLLLLFLYSFCFSDSLPKPKKL